MHRQIRTDRDRFRKASPMQRLGATATPTTLPGLWRRPPKLASTTVQHGKRNLQGRQVLFRKPPGGKLPAQELAESFPDHRTAPASHQKSPRESLSARTPLKHFASEERPRQQLYPEHPPHQLRDMMFQLGEVTKTLQKVVRKLAELTLGEVPPTLGAELAVDDC